MSDEGNDNIPEIPFDVFEDLFKYAQKEKRQTRQREKDQWIAKARALFEPTLRGFCYICGKHRAITQAHHIVPLADQFDRGFEHPDQCHVWLCPNHHTVLHRFLGGAPAEENGSYSALLEGFDRKMLSTLHALLMRSRQGLDL